MVHRLIYKQNKENIQKQHCFFVCQLFTALVGHRLEQAVLNFSALCKYLGETCTNPLIAAKQHSILGQQLSSRFHLFVCLSVCQYVINAFSRTYPRNSAHAQYGSMIMISHFCITKATLFAWSIDLIKTQYANQFFTQTVAIFRVS